MRILLVGATGIVGSAVAAALSERHKVIPASRSSEVSVDIAGSDSIRAMYDKLGTLDAVVCAAGQTRFAPLERLSEEDFRFTPDNKPMGQVNLVRLGFAHLADGGSITLTGGRFARCPVPGSAAIGLVNAGLEGFVRAAALESPRGIRVNLVSPPWVKEKLRALGRDDVIGLGANHVALAYVRSIEGSESGQTIEP